MPKDFHMMPPAYTVALLFFVSFGIIAIAGLAYGVQPNADDALCIGRNIACGLCRACHRAAGVFATTAPSFVEWWGPIKQTAEKFHSFSEKCLNSRQ